MPARHTLSLLAAAALAAPLMSPLVATPAAAVVQDRRAHPVPPVHPSQVVLDWERTAIETIYGPVGATPRTPIPVGALYLGLTSQAVWDAVQRSTRAPRSSEAAAASTAAHDVLLAYFPASAADLHAAHHASLDDVRDGPAKTNGTGIGHAVATELIADRLDDGRNNDTIVYDKPALPGFWQPVGPKMLAPWLGSVDYLALDGDLAVDGPDAMTSPEYAADFEEVRRFGRELVSDRSDFQTETAKFYNSNAATMYAEGVLDRLEEEPIGLRRTARLFATMHVAQADTLIRAWELKRDVGFWRPFQAIVGADADDNPLTIPEQGWKPLIPNPPYSDYISGHGSATSSAIEAIRMELGEDYVLTLHSYITNTDRTYAQLSDIEHEALHARIWGGLHFRDAMDDAYDLGHRTAKEVRAALR